MADSDIAEKQRQKPGPRKPHAGNFKPGVSGNPGGRQKVSAHVKELAQQYTELAINTLADVCKSADKDTARVHAAIALLDRAWGKPYQEIIADVKTEIDAVVESRKETPQEMLTRAKNLVALLEQTQ